MNKTVQSLAVVRKSGGVGLYLPKKIDAENYFECKINAIKSENKKIDSG